MRRSVTAVWLLALVLVVPATGAFVNSGDPWSQSAKLEDRQKGWHDEFGTTIAVDGNTMVVGHPQENFNTNPVSPENVGAVTVFEREDGEWTRQQTFYGPQPKGRLGGTIALDGDTFVTNAAGFSTGNSTDDWCPFSTAELYVYERIDGDWTQTQTLQAPGAEPGDSCLGGTRNFDSIALDGDLLVVGDPWTSSEVHVFERASNGGWTLDATLRPPPETIQIGHPFGRTVEVSSAAQRIVVGEPLEEKESRTVHVYDRAPPAWERTTTLHGCCAWAGSQLSLSSDGTTLAFTRSPYFQSDPIEVWEQTGQGWTRVASLRPHDVNNVYPLISDLELSAEGDSLAVGAWLDDVTPSVAPDTRDQIPVGLASIRLGTPVEDIVSPFGNGATYMFRTNETGAWHQTAKIMPHDEFGENRFGWDVSLDGDTLAVGAPGDLAGTGANCCPGEDTGASYVFEHVDGLSEALANQPEGISAGPAPGP